METQGAYSSREGKRKIILYKGNWDVGQPVVGYYYTQLTQCFDCLCLSVEGGRKGVVQHSRSPRSQSVTGRRELWACCIQVFSQVATWDTIEAIAVSCKWYSQAPQ